MHPLSTAPFFPANVPLDKYSKRRPTIDYFSSPVGGGIIVPHIDRDEWWLGWPVLSADLTGIRNPAGVPPGRDTGFGSRVRYLEPHDNSPEVQLGLKKRPRLFTCKVTPEHADEAGDELYWLVSTKRKNRRSRALDDIPTWTEPFDVRLKRLDQCPEPLLQKQDDWFLSSDFEPTWYHAITPERDVGLHFAVLLYIALLACSVSSGLQSMHLVAQIDRRPRYRHTWGLRTRQSHRTNR